MKYLLITCLIILSLSSSAQDDVKVLQETAKNYVKQGDFNKAVVTLTRAFQQEPGNIDVQKELAFAQYYQKDLGRALETVKPLLERRDAQVQVYQLAGLIYAAKDDDQEAEKVYKKGIKKFPESAVLYNDYGEFLWNKQDNNAIRQWEKGMEADPNYAANYYNAARYSSDKIWGVIYAEIFINMESFTRRSIEIKYQLLHNYRKLLADISVAKYQNNKNPFISAYIKSVNKEAALVSAAITPESLIMLRTRFILEWNDKYSTKFPFRLFDYHKQLLKDGLFEAYNQWLFGPIQNLTAFQNWTNKHTEPYTEFTGFQHSRIFKIPSGQNYQNRKEDK